MNVDYWIAFLKHDPEAFRSFQEYLQSFISESSKQFKTVKSLEELNKIQGSIEALERVLRDSNRSQIQEMEHALYEQRGRTSQPSS